MVTLEQEGITNGGLRDMRLKEEEGREILYKDLRALEEEAGEKLGASPLFARKNSMRNKPCPCKSGKKFKKCCWSKFNEVSL